MEAFSYETAEQPPAPYLDLKIRPSLPSRRFLAQRAKLDSGASMTVIPSALVDRWRLTPFSLVIVRSYDGQVSGRPTYLVDITIGKRRFAQVEVTLAPRTNVLLGRDVLNRLRVTLDGPSQITEIHDV
jgi:predicted aspartyl protease